MSASENLSSLARHLSNTVWQSLAAVHCNGSKRRHKDITLLVRIWKIRHYRPTCKFLRILQLVYFQQNTRV